MKKTKIGISVGDINGVGIEVIIKTFLDPQMMELCTPIVYGSSKTVSHYRKSLDIHDFSFNKIDDAKDANPKKANIIDCWNEEAQIDFGKSTPEAGKYAFVSLEAATKDLNKGKIDAIVTAPINKDNIQSEDFKFSGHTEYLESKSTGESLMLMISENLKVGMVTGHIPVKSIANNISSDKIFGKIKVLNKSLIQDFAINSPKIAVLGLNPHAGDNGLLGTEEDEIITPAINNAKSIGLNVFGPYAADGFFGSGNYKKFDAVLAMYHDQGLIPFKSIAFGSGINFTAGLDIIRTSPDHGVAYDIAGKNIANEQSFRSAIYLAIDVVKNRIMDNEINENPLKAARVK
ncbi:MAG: 4-hydroxythreonine-4-phosphate dehydrogenase PdxA [Flavobacteriales bacterium]|nr:4-hydroxythreonine-4-phosphate dehydrogenase PdxA [Flavobacteriales bacterium]MCB9364360.1 4-hydroxythreonine-4-phosphate dehydrogenase PdxA [Flavobacteriales bacterium]